MIDGGAAVLTGVEHGSAETGVMPSDKRSRDYARGLLHASFRYRRQKSVRRTRIGPCRRSRRHDGDPNHDNGHLRLPQARRPNRRASRAMAVAANSFRKGHQFIRGDIKSSFLVRGANPLRMLSDYHFRGFESPIDAERHTHKATSWELK